MRNHVSKIRPPKILSFRHEIWHAGRFLCWELYCRMHPRNILRFSFYGTSNIVSSEISHNPGPLRIAETRTTSPVGIVERQN